MYPEIEPYEHGLLDVGDGNRVYWESCGNPFGKPAVVLHGGPGSGAGPDLRRFFDPDTYRIVLFDQRGCGRSGPSAGTLSTDLSVNTIDHLIADMERLRAHLGIDRWLVFGGSFGCVLALVYAQRYPVAVTEMVLTGLATGRRAETDLLTRLVGAAFPEAWQRFQAGLPAQDRDGDPAAGYARLLADPDPAVRDKAARDWCDWEDAIDWTRHDTASSFSDPEFRLTFARLVTHYWANGCFLEDGQVLRDMGRLDGIPATLVQGTLDLVNLVGTPWLLHQRWPGSELVLVDDAGHTAREGGKPRALVAATDGFASEYGSRTWSRS